MIRRLLLAVTLPMTLAAAPSGAMTVEDAPLATLVAEADAVLRAFVVATEAVPDPRAPGSARLWTRVTLAIAEVDTAPEALALADTFTLLLPGGASATHRTVVPCVPTLLPGDEVVALLALRNHRWQPLGYHLGLLFVDAAGDLWRAGPRGRPATRLRPRDAAALPATLTGAR